MDRVELDILQDMAIDQHGWIHAGQARLLDPCIEIDKTLKIDSDVLKSQKYNASAKIALDICQQLENNNATIGQVMEVINYMLMIVGGSKQTCKFTVDDRVSNLGIFTE